MISRLFFLILFLTILTPSAFPNDKAAPSPSTTISSKEFLSSKFSKYFKAHQYQKALDALKPLSKKYPKDPLLIRYQALTLQRLGRREEAITLYQKLLSENPKHAPTRIFLGRAYLRQGKNKLAAEEFRGVLLHSKEKTYRRWAQAELNRLRLGVKKSPRKKRFYFVSKFGIAYDSNPLLVPNDKSLRAPGGKKRGMDYLMSWTAGYKLRARKDSRIDLIYRGQESLHSPSAASRVNFHSHGFAVDAKKRHLFGRRAVLFNGRYDFRSNFLRSRLFSISNRFFLGADTSLTRRTRTHVYSRFNLLNFGPDGSDPSQTSRDGFRMGIGFTQYFYTSDLQRYFFVKEEFNLNESRGENFDRRGVLSRVGIHTPVDFLKKMDWDLSGGFDYGDYHDFTSFSSLNTEERDDARWDIYTALTYHWTRKFATRTFYRFIKANNRNNFFDRDRHLAGGEVIFAI